MMKDKPNYFAILTSDVRYDKRLSASEKLFYAEITALTNIKGYCWASNKYFADLYNVKRSTISAWVKKLTQTNHIKVEMYRQGKVIVERRIYLIDPPNIGGQKIGGVVNKSEEGWSENPNRGGQKIRKVLIQEDINTSDININAFECFWDKYDKKVDKKKAQQSFNRLSQKDIEQLMKFIPIYKKSVRHKQYLKNPATFLNSRIWEDDWNEYKPNEPTNTNTGRTQYALDRYHEIFGEDFPEE